jgi:hypothetical protein
MHVGTRVSPGVPFFVYFPGLRDFDDSTTVGIAGRPAVGWLENEVLDWINGRVRISRPNA